MSKTVEQIRRENGVKWPEIFKALGGRDGFTKKMRKRIEMPRKLKMSEIRRTAKRHGGLADWLSEITLCEAMRSVANLQTDIEDFVPTTQPARPTANEKAA